MDLQIGDIQETALITLAIRASETERQWRTKSGKEYLDLEPRMSLVSERSYNEEMKKYSIFTSFR